jgi:uncharacterized DUF497 family protein
MLQFEWDTNKAAKNLQKHQIAFSEAATIFGDPLSTTFSDPDHSDFEERYITIGLSNQNHILIVTHTDRENVIRLISARKATRQERNFYENTS